MCFNALNEQILLNLFIVHTFFNQVRINFFKKKYIFLFGKSTLWYGFIKIGIRFIENFITFFNFLIKHYNETKLSYESIQRLVAIFRGP